MTRLSLLLLSSRIRIHQPPRSQGQRLQLHRRRSDIAQEGDDANDDADDVGDVIPIPFSSTGATAVQASMFLCFQSAGEGSGDEIGLEEVGFGRGGRRMAGGDSEVIDEFEDEETGECAA